jgi:hypothetical protein
MNEESPAITYHFSADTRQKNQEVDSRVIKKIVYIRKEKVLLASTINIKYAAIDS